MQQHFSMAALEYFSGNKPTHNKGLTLDLFTSKGLNISIVEVLDIAGLSCAFFNMTATSQAHSRSDTI